MEATRNAHRRLTASMFMDCRECGELECFEDCRCGIVWQKSFTQDFGGKEPTWDTANRLWSMRPADLFARKRQRVRCVHSISDRRSGLANQARSFRQFEGTWRCWIFFARDSNARSVKQYITLTGKGVTGVDAKSGELLWCMNAFRMAPQTFRRRSFKANLFCVPAAMAMAHGTDSVSKARGKVAWKEIYYFPAKEIQNHHGGMILIDGFVYMVKDTTTAFRLAWI